MWWDIFSHYFQITIKPEEEQFVIFIDDTLQNFTASKKILGLLVPSHTKTPDERPQLSFRARKIWKKYKINETYDCISGISISGFYTLTKQILQHKNNILQVIIDWDKTLSVHSSYKTETINKYTTECYFGGYKRMNAIKYFFKKMKRNNIEVKILTNNGRAKRDATAFTKALSYVNGKWIKVEHTEIPCKTNLINKMLRI